MLRVVIVVAVTWV